MRVFRLQCGFSRHRSRAKVAKLVLQRNHYCPVKKQVLCRKGPVDLSFESILILIDFSFLDHFWCDGAAFEQIGTSENAVKTQVWMALCVYLLVAIIRKRLSETMSMGEMLQFLSVTFFKKTPISQVFSQQEFIIVQAEIHKLLPLLDLYPDSTTAQYMLKF